MCRAAHRSHPVLGGAGASASSLFARQNLGEGRGAGRPVRLRVRSRERYQTFCRGTAEELSVTFWDATVSSMSTELPEVLTVSFTVARIRRS